MSGDRQRAKKSERRREFPALAEKKKVGPKPPGSELRSNQKGSLSIDAKNGTEQGGQRGISRKKGDVGYFHYLVIDGRNDRLVAAVDNIREPVAVVLDQTGVAVRKGAFGRQQENGDHHLDKRQQEPH